MSDDQMNGSGTAKTVKQLVLEHDTKLDEIRSELDKAKGALYVAVALNLLNALPQILGWINDQAVAVGMITR